MTYAYTRVSTERQNLQRQIDNITKELTAQNISCERIFSDKYTGTKLDRPGFDKLLKAVRPGDTIYFDSVSRMSRNAAEGVKLYFDLYEQGVNLIFLNEPLINSDVYRNTQQITIANAQSDKILQKIEDFTNDLLKTIAEKQIEAAFEQAQKEVDDLHSRTSGGMKAKGATNIVASDGTILEQGSISKAKTGMTYNVSKAEKAKQMIRLLSKDFEGTEDDATVMAQIGIARNTFYKYKRELKTATEAI